ncbi:MAG: YifB family Mg chelatase-like AAA ATPase [Candidatus Pacebacteria bacterium]|nr:YifB family Mg chelatase-like AAA ATPase [Candidatus Paceibacterota bacterium]
MAHARTYSAQIHGLETHIVSIEVDTSNGLHSFSVVGLGDKAVEESKDRVSSAIKNSGYKSPKHKNQKLVISLAPADMKKEGPIFDLGMALAYLLAAGDIDFDPNGKLFLGELALDGSVRQVHGVLPVIKAAISFGYSEIFIPCENAAEAGLVKDARIYPVSSLVEAVGHLEERKGCCLFPIPKTEIKRTEQRTDIDMSLIRGQESAKRGLEIAAAGGHNIALYGPPGTGKTMLAKAFRGILPPLTEDETIEVTAIHSIARTLGCSIITEPPFRAPHHTASYASIVGGGAFPRPGEITLAHRGVLFLDEFPEFHSSVIDALREPLEEKRITVARARGSVTFPAHCILVVAMNPCPCGFGDDRCTCSAGRREQYLHKISGPLIDRIDVWVAVSKIEYDKFGTESGKGETSDRMAARIEKARALQYDRCRERSIAAKCNSELNVPELEKVISLPSTLSSFFGATAERLGLSGRGYHRILKIARTIADLDGKGEIEKAHILEALQYRQKLI